MDEVTIGDKIYVSAKRAAEITGYARDYVGQLCREGHIEAKMVGRSWYVYEPSIRAHRFGEGSEEAEMTQTQPAERPERENRVPESTDFSMENDVEGSDNAPDAVGTWQNPVYTAEEAEILPSIPVFPESESLTDMQSAWREWFETRQTALESGISDAPELETPEIIDARAEAYAAEEIENEEEEHVDEDHQQNQEIEEDDEEIAVPLHRIEEVEEVEELQEEEPEADEAEESNEEQVQIHRVRPVEPVRLVPPPAAQIARPQSQMYAPVSRYQEQHTRREPQEGRVLEERIVRRAGTKAKKKSNAPIIAVFIGVCILSITVAAIGSGLAAKYIHTTAGNNPVIDFLVGTRQYSR